MKRILCISGTSRPNNYTAHALAVVRDELAAKGAEITYLDARNMTLGFPGYPETDDAKALQEAVHKAQGLVLATPEYHGSYCAMMKLIIENMGFPSALKGKPVALLGVAAGRIGAIKSLEQLRGVCAHTGAIVLPMPISIAGARSAFNEEGRCQDEGTEAVLRTLAQSLLDFIRDFVCPRYELEALARQGDVTPWTTAV